MPPFSRRERIEDYGARVEVEGDGSGKGEGRGRVVIGGVEWREERVRARDGVEVALVVGEVGDRTGEENGQERGRVRRRGRKGLLFIFKVFTSHRNGGSIPPRLPAISQVLRLLHERQRGEVKHTLVALSYRGFWKSEGRPSEKGIKLDAAAAIEWAAEHHPGASLTLWGQSIGAGVATSAAAESQHRPSIDKLILETPFTSVRDMLATLYPQKWLPYRYLYPFLWNHWDSCRALQEMTVKGKSTQVLIVSAENDELVPPSHGQTLESVCKATGLTASRVVIKGALHHEVLFKPEGRKAIMA
ncbi:uncharacterized protein KY384_001651 [Bacidia gigantensis]|uniref:uncharacterized protein n=1 Tax=Bacidia gigantensis TaxID=2732470 RepID=UPI001D05349A|nr:uncharacterized protein KY384_001651 [Bacidia gigantensis]KAG8533910.1 hypothetical protein KY384_001651 [Bacidia gigantensis]